MVNNIIATAGLIEVIGLELFGTILKDEFSRCFFKSNAELQSGRFQEESITRVGKTLPSQVYDDQFISMRLMIMIPLIKIF